MINTVQILPMYTPACICLLIYITPLKFICPLTCPFAFTHPFPYTHPLHSKHSCPLTHTPLIFTLTHTFCLSCLHLHLCSIPPMFSLTFLPTCIFTVHLTHIFSYLLPYLHLPLSPITLPSSLAFHLTCIFICVSSHLHIDHPFHPHFHSCSSHQPLFTFCPTCIFTILSLCILTTFPACIFTPHIFAYIHPAYIFGHTLPAHVFAYIPPTFVFKLPVINSSLLLLLHLLMLPPHSVIDHTFLLICTTLPAPSSALPNLIALPPTYIISLCLLCPYFALLFCLSPLCTA